MTTHDREILTAYVFGFITALIVAFVFGWLGLCSPV